jgi:hypothetical protein
VVGLGARRGAWGWIGSFFNPFDDYASRKYFATHDAISAIVNVGASVREEKPNTRSSVDAINPKLFHGVPSQIERMEMTRRACPAAWSAMTMLRACFDVPAQSMQSEHWALRPPSMLAGHVTSRGCLSTPMDTLK